MRRLLALLAAVTLLVLGLSGRSVAAPAVPPAEPHKRALVIGISQYEPPTRPTFGGAGDAEAWQSALLKNGWAKENIRMLVDGDATADNIRSGLDWLVSNSRPDTFSVLHYSGHTKQEPRGMDDGDPEEYDELLWGVNNEFIADGELAQRLRSLQGRSVISMADCEAAGFDDGISGPNRLFLAASRETEKAYEYSQPPRSVFVEFLVAQGLLGGAGDKDGNKTVSLQEAFGHAAAMAPVVTAKQEPYGPQNPVMAGGDGTQWYLRAPAPAPKLLGGLIPPGLIPPGLLPGGLLSGAVRQTP